MKCSLMLIEQGKPLFRASNFKKWDGEGEIYIVDWNQYKKEEKTLSGVGSCISYGSKDEIPKLSSEESVEVVALNHKVPVYFSGFKHKAFGEGCKQCDAIVFPFSAKSMLFIEMKYIKETSSSLPKEDSKKQEFVEEALKQITDTVASLGSQNSCRLYALLAFPRAEAYGAGLLSRDSLREISKKCSIALLIGNQACFRSEEEVVLVACS